jgi:VanZ family protein
VARSRYALAAVLYALLVAYASTFVGVAGPHFVQIDPSEALHRLIQVPYVENGSDQRSDWMGNLMMLAPLGFLVTGWLSPDARTSIWSAPGAIVLCFLYIVAVKYAQLFFPPRTVTLNYIIAQGLGATAGALLFGVSQQSLTRLRDSMAGLESLRLVLWIYTASLILFLLMPLDFALSVDDFIAQLDRLPDSFTAISGEGRPLIVRTVVILGGIVAMMPVGAMLTIVERGRVYVGRTTGDATWFGLCAMIGVYAATCLVLSGSPSLVAIGFRTVGIALGAWIMHWLTRRDPNRIRHDLGRLVPWVVPVYLVTVAAVNGLLSFEWTTPSEAARSFYIYGLLPLFNYYIVTKPQAAKNLIGHAILYAPIGVMVWLRAKHEGGKAAAFVLAALLSALVEAGRFLRPGLVPDINAIPLAGFAAWAAVAVMPMLWRMLSAVAIAVPVMVPLRSGDTTTNVPAIGGGRDRSNVIGEVEDY